MHFIFDASSKRTIHPNKCRQLTFLLVSMIKLFDLILIEMKWQFCICLDKLKQDFLFFLTNWINPQPWFAQVYSDAFVSYTMGGSESLTLGYVSLQYWRDIIYEKPLDSFTEPWQSGLHTTFSVKKSGLVLLDVNRRLPPASKKRRGLFRVLGCPY